MALAARNLPGIWIYDVLKLNTPNPGYLILSPKIPISTSNPYDMLHYLTTVVCSENRPKAGKIHISPRKE